MCHPEQKQTLSESACKGDYLQYSQKMVQNKCHQRKTKQDKVRIANLLKNKTWKWCADFLPFLLETPTWVEINLCLTVSNQISFPVLDLGLEIPADFMEGTS